MTHQPIHSSDLSDPIGPFAQGTIVSASGSFVFASGMTSRAPDGRVVGEDAAAQTEQTLENLATLLEAAGTSLSEVFKITIYVTDMDDLEAIHNVRRRYFAGKLPASTLVQVSGLVDESMLVEVEAIAHIPAE